MFERAIWYHPERDCYLEEEATMDQASLDEIAMMCVPVSEEEFMDYMLDHRDDPWWSQKIVPRETFEARHP